MCSSRRVVSLIVLSVSWTSTKLYTSTLVGLEIVAYVSGSQRVSIVVSFRLSLRAERHGAEKNQSGAPCGWGAVPPDCGAHLTIQALMSAIVRDGECHEAGKGLAAVEKAASAVVVKWRRMMKMRLDVKIRGKTTKAGTYGAVTLQWKANGSMAQWLDCSEMKCVLVVTCCEHDQT